MTFTNKEAVCCLIKHPKENKYLGVTRRGTSDEWGLPGGKIEENELSIGNIGRKIAARRELEEETGFKMYDYSDTWPEKFVPILSREPVGDDKYSATCYWINYYKLNEPEKLVGDAGKVDWITQEQLENGPFGDYNKLVFKDGLYTPTTNDELLDCIKKNLPTLKKMLEEANSHWTYEDYIYRYYHHSFKVYGIQSFVKSTVLEFERINGFEPLNSTFSDIVKNGTGIRFEYEHNKNWDEHTQPQLQAFFHTKYMLEMMVKYGDELAEAPNILPSGWASVLYLFNMR